MTYDEAILRVRDIPIDSKVRSWDFCDKDADAIAMVLARLSDVEAALTFYADADTWKPAHEYTDQFGTSCADFDRGGIARTALGVNR